MKFKNIIRNKINTQTKENVIKKKIIKKLMIANRGEIAVRIIRAAKDEAIKTVAIYSDIDRNSLHVKLADEAYSLNGNSLSDSYLSIDKIINIALKTKVDAIHPGYGFLSENANFAQSVINIGVLWIGPTPSTIEILGNKVKARYIAQKVGAPLLPGSLKPIISIKEIQQFGKKFGFPIAIKAVFGGGGRGIKIIQKFKDINNAYESAVRESILAFGQGECFIEKFLYKPRHIETQCLTDINNKTVILSTRDCSIQRRSQKLVEEGPAPYLTHKQEQTIHKISKNIMKEVGYIGAGTCEFLISQSGELVFLEVNTRLQVEHGISEEITGIDIVREQINLACNKRLNYKSPSPKRHSFEFRINCENPKLKFLPSLGKINKLNFPHGPGIRIESGIQLGDRINNFYDSMLAKLIITGLNRKQALERSRRALSEINIEGIKTIIPFYRKLIQSKDFSPELYENTNEKTIGFNKFKIHTQWVEEFCKKHFSSQNINNTSKQYNNNSKNENSIKDFVAEVDGKRISIRLYYKNSSKYKKNDYMKNKLERNLYREYASLNIQKINNKNNNLEKYKKFDDFAIISPIHGILSKIHITQGSKIKKNQLIATLESMKMEQQITSDYNGIISCVKVKIGDNISAGEIIAQLER